LRDLFVTGAGPDSGGSNQGSDPWRHMPEKSGIDAALSLLLWAGAAVGAACPKAGVAAAAANATTKRKSRRCKVMLSSLFMGFDFRTIGQSVTEDDVGEAGKSSPACEAAKYAAPRMQPS
jgi:hypothetical protein